MRCGKSARSAAIAAALLLCAAAAPAQESEPAKTLTPGKGSDLTSTRCGICHEVTHITLARLSRGEWEDNVKNMIERGAPIAPAEIPVIIEYLATYYNRDAAAPAPDATAAASGADPVQKLLAANACLGCHGVSQQIVGPAFRDVATRYAGDKTASGRLAAKIKAGGSGNWGRLAMPAHAHLKDAELAQLVDWILAQK